MSDSQKWLLVVVSAVVAWVFYLLAPVLTPFLVATLFAYLADPLVHRLQQWKLSRTLAVVLVFLVILLVIVLGLLLLVPQMEHQFRYLLDKLPQLVGWLQEAVVPWLNATLGVEVLEIDLETVRQFLGEHWRSTGGVTARVAGAISSSGMALAGWLAGVVLIPVVLFYLLRDWDLLLQHMRILIPRRHVRTVTKLTREADEVLGAFLRGQLLVMLSLGTIYTLGLWIIGLKPALLVGLLAGLVSFVPYLGFIVGVIAAAIASLTQTPDLLQLIPVLIVFGVGQALEGMVLTPWLVGDRVGLHPVAVIFAVLAGGQLFGFVGVLLALPVAAVIAVLLRHALVRYTDSELYGQANG